MFSLMISKDHLHHLKLSHGIIACSNFAFNTEWVSICALRIILCYSAIDTVILTGQSSRKLDSWYCLSRQKVKDIMTEFIDSLCPACLFLFLADRSALNKDSQKLHIHGAYETNSIDFSSCKDYKFLGIFLQQGTFAQLKCYGFRKEWYALLGIKNAPVERWKCIVELHEILVFDHAKYMYKWSECAADNFLERRIDFPFYLISLLYIFLTTSYLPIIQLS